MIDAACGYDPPAVKPPDPVFEQFCQEVGHEAATDVLHYLDTMYSQWWAQMPKSFRTNLRRVIEEKVRVALKR